MNAVYAIFTQLHKLRSLRRSFLHFHFISAVHIWFISYIINTLFFHGNIWTHNWPAPNASGFIAQLVEHRTGIARSRVQTPLKSWIFFFRLLYAIGKIAFTATIISSFSWNWSNEMFLPVLQRSSAISTSKSNLNAFEEFSLEFADNCETRGHISVFKPCYRC